MGLAAGPFTASLGNGPMPTKSKGLTAKKATHLSTFGCKKANAKLTVVVSTELIKPSPKAWRGTPLYAVPESMVES